MTEEELKPVPQPLPQPRNGKLVIQNWTGLSQYVSVNGSRFYVGPGRTEMRVPALGTARRFASTQL